MKTPRRFGATVILAAGLLAGCAEQSAVTPIAQEPLAQEFVGPGSVIPGASMSGSDTLILESADPKGGYFPDWGYLLSQPAD